MVWSEPSFARMLTSRLFNCGFEQYLAGAFFFWMVSRNWARVRVKLLCHIDGRIVPACNEAEEIVYYYYIFETAQSLQYLHSRLEVPGEDSREPIKVLR